MFGTRIPVPDTEPTRENPGSSEDLVPLSVLGLDHGVPPEGWSNFLGRRGITLRPDHIGRDAISSHDAQKLLYEQRAAQVRAVKLRQLQEQEAVEQDQLRRAAIGRGVPTSMIPSNQSYAEAALAAQLNEPDYRPKRKSLMEEVFENSKEMTIYPLEREEVELQ